MAEKATPAQPATAAHAAKAAEPAGAPASWPESALFHQLQDLAVEARAVELIEVEAPWGIPGLPDKVQVGVLHRSEGPQLVDLRPFLEKYRDQPERRSGTARVATLRSFIDLVNRHKDEGSAVFAATTWPNPSLTAVIDYSTRGEARHGKHRVEYRFPVTPEFQAWMDGNGKALEQGDFARFLELHMAELAAPYDPERLEYEALFKVRLAVPSELFELSRNLEIRVGTKVKRQERLQSGERAITFESEHQTAAGEKVDIPGVFMVAMPAFMDGEPVRMPARLYYRLKGESIWWHYQLYRPEHWLRAQVQLDLIKVGEETSLPCVEGAPEAA